MKCTALIWLFSSNNAYETDFKSDGFKILWDFEKDINHPELKRWILNNNKLIEKDRLINDIFGSSKFIKWISSYSKHIKMKLNTSVPTWKN